MDINNKKTLKFGNDIRHIKMNLEMVKNVAFTALSRRITKGCISTWRKMNREERITKQEKDFYDKHRNREIDYLVRLCLQM